MKKIALLLLFPLALMATVNEPWRWELLSGYRNDFLHWHLNPNSGMQQSEKFRDVEFWDNQLTYKVIHRDIVFYINGGYSAFGRGTLQEKLSDLPFTPLPQQFKFSTSGWAIDGSSYLGYAVNLTADRTYKVILMPLLGYSGHYLRVKGSGTKSSPEVAVNYPNPTKQTWYGLSAGGGIKIEPGGRLLFDVGYQYHWLHLVFKSQFQEVFGATTQVNTLKTKRGSNLGHSGWARMDYQLDRFWRVGAVGTLNYYVSQHYTVKQHQNDNVVEAKFKLRWTSFSLLFALSREI